MWMVPHTLAGITAVETIENPAISLSVAFLSHYLLDFIPHWTQYPSFYGKTAKYLYLDFVISLSIGLYFAFSYPFGSYQFWLVIAGAALGNLPDAIQIPVLLRHGHTASAKFWAYDLLERFHRLVDQDVLHKKNDLVWKFMKGQKVLGILTQVLVGIVCLFILL